jgi:type IV pilus assembly protein PilW
MRSRSRGISLIEILISLVIGLVIVGAVLISMIGSGKAGRYQAAYTQMNEDAQIGLSILSRELQQAGYSSPTGLGFAFPATVPPTQVLQFAALVGSTRVIGCDTGFTNPGAAIGVALVCGTGTEAAFEVVYEADGRSTVATAAGVPTDCLGMSILVGPPFIARNRYFITQGASGRPELSCTSAGATAAGRTPQPLLENIESMAILYGVEVAGSPPPAQVVRYVTATQVRAVVPPDWPSVISVRVCLVVRSSDPVLDNGEDSPTYSDCAGAKQTPTDRYLRRAYFTTAAIRDRMP